MIDFLISLLATYVTSDLLSWYLYPMICLGLLYIFPSFVRSLFSWR